LGKLRAPEPSAFITRSVSGQPPQRSSLSFWTNAIVEPSGETAGSVSSSGVCVSRTSAEPSGATA